MFASNRMRAIGWTAALFLAVLPCHSQTTLRSQLQHRGIPESSFSKAELDEIVDGASVNKDQYSYYVYLRTKDGMLTGNPHLLRYDQKTGTILRSELHLREEDPYCCGSPEGIDFIDDYILIYFHFNPSAAAALVLDSKLKMIGSLDGFGMERVAPNQVVFTENMVHFAPSHQECQLWVNLEKREALELYPTKNDALRNQFESTRDKNEPEACKQSQQEEQCQYGSYDESCFFLGGDGNGRFGLDCERSATYLPKDGESTIELASDQAIYIYASTAKGWIYCEQAISKEEARMLENTQEHAYEGIKNRCTPSLPVVPDMSSSDFNPFSRPSRHAK